MAGQRRSLIALFAVALVAPVFAQEPAATAISPSTPAPKKVPRRPPAPTSPEGTPSPELETVRRAIEALTPEQRQQFRENFNRWINLAPDEKRALRDVQESRRKHIAEEVDAALKEAGLELDPIRRQVFTRRYSEERRKVEEQLRAETQAKRTPLVAAIVQRLKSEFAAPSVAPTAPVP